MKLMILDGNSLVNRAFYGIRMLNAPDGTPTNALYGFLAIVRHIPPHCPDTRHVCPLTRLWVLFSEPGMDSVVQKYLVNERTNGRMTSRTGTVFFSALASGNTSSPCLALEPGQLCLRMSLCLHQLLQPWGAWLAPGNPLSRSEKRE